MDAAPARSGRSERGGAGVTHEERGVPPSPRVGEPAPRVKEPASCEEERRGARSGRVEGPAAEATLRAEREGAALARVTPVMEGRSPVRADSPWRRACVPALCLTEGLLGFGFARLDRSEPVAEARDAGSPPLRASTRPRSSFDVDSGARRCGPAPRFRVMRGPCLRVGRLRGRRCERDRRWSRKRPARLDCEGARQAPCARLLRCSKGW